MNPILVNGVQHAWASIVCTILGRQVTGITAIAYGNERDIENQYGAGDEPVARSMGNNNYSGNSITLYQWEVVAIQQACGGDITLIPPFDVTVHYKSTGSSPAVTDVIKNCQLKLNKRDWKQNDLKQEVQLDLVVAGIKWHSL